MRTAVVIPCFNVVEHIDAALASVLAQTHQDLDIVCVDDGSTDGTSELLADHAARTNGRIRVITSIKRGASHARNLGLHATAGTYVQFLDADDVIHPEKISAQLELARDHGTPALIVGDFEQIMPNGLILPMLALYDRPWMALITTRLGTTSANLWKRSTLIDVGGWSEQLASSQDYELMYRVLRSEGAVCFDRRVATQVLKRASGSISQTDVMQNWDRYIGLRRSIKEHLELTDRVRFLPEIEVLKQYIFMALRIVAAEDRGKAVAEYGRSIGKGFRPEVSKAITERYALLHKLLGFSLTERLLHLVKGPRSNMTTV